MNGSPVTPKDDAIAAFVRTALAASGDNSFKLAERLGVNYATLRRYIRGDRPMTAGLFLSILEDLDTSLEDAASEIWRLEGRIQAGH